MQGFTYSVVASSLHDPSQVDRLLAPVVERLHELDGRRAEAVDLEARVPHVIVVGTGGTEAAIVELIRHRHAYVPSEPVILVAHGLHNSLPAALEALALVLESGIAGRVVQVEQADELAEAIGDLQAVHWFRNARLGLVGEPSDWLVASVPDRGGVSRRWGLHLVDVPVEEAIRGHAAVPDAGARSVAVRFTGGAEPDHDTITAAAMHPALEQLIELHEVDAVAVRCFDFLTELQTSGCVALAQLNDSGIVAGCEGDVASTVAMMLARQVLDQPSWIANPARIDAAAGEILLAHCTVAPSMVEDVELHTHFESGLGIGLRGRFAPGPVTLIRLGGTELQRHWISEGEIVESGSAEDLCRTQVRLQGVDGLDRLLDEPLGNHLVMVHGHHRRRLERWLRLARTEAN